MFNTKKFFQAVGMSILLTIVVSFIVGFFPILNFGIFLTIQAVLTYGSMGIFAARWNREAPYTSAYLGAVLISILNLFVSYLLFNIDVFANPEGISGSLSFSVIVSLTFAAASIFLRTKREGVLN